jgi:glycogen operon protein
VPALKPLSAGLPRPLGAHLTKRGVNFALHSSRATRVEVCLFDAVTDAVTARYDLPGRTGDVWHGLVPARWAGSGTHYAFCVHGPDEPDRGLRFSDAMLIDPCARELSRGGPLRCRVVDPAFAWGADRPPAVPWRDTLIYELHVKGYTQRHPQVPAEFRGKYLGLAAPAVIGHLQAIGVTAVELLPVQAFVSEQFLIERGLKNYWGYNSVAWFAPANEYAVAEPVVEFKTMVKALHAAGIEVIIDVVFNHTAEGNEFGPTLSLRGIDNPLYYRLMKHDPRYYENLTGCGNTVNCEHPAVRALIIDCMKHWVEEMHVDGFRFDLATVLAREDNGFNENSPFFKAVRAQRSLAYVKLIAEPWDVGLGGYQLGHFPAGWTEWNDRYRDTVRAFWKGDGGKLGELAERLAGSSDLFRYHGRGPTASLNFITAHDGFTLRDLVAYNDRHNEANLENNADGTSNNLSWNCGAEGPTDDEEINLLRRRQVRNLLATLFLSQGVPMLQAGDECGRTQQGNNNAYCQDNAISWIDWDECGRQADLIEYVAGLLRLRREYPEFRRDTFLKGTTLRAGSKDVTWLNARGGEMTHADWLDGNARTLGVWYGRMNSPVGRLLLLLNASHLPQSFVLPAALPGRWWRPRFDTSFEPSFEPRRSAQEMTPANMPVAITQYDLGPRSVALLEC